MTEFVGNPDPGEDFFTKDGKQHCWACGTDWPLEQQWERFCGECGHLWPTADDLVEHDYQAQVELDAVDGVVYRGGRRPVELIDVCPCCVHDL